MSNDPHLGAVVVVLLSSFARPQGDPPNRAPALRVHVDLADGHPAAGAHVTVAAWHEGLALASLLERQPNADVPSGPKWVQGVADQSGDVALVPISAVEACSVLATTPGKRAIVYVGWPRASSVTLRLHEPATLTLHVLDPQDRPVGGATIGLGSSNGSARSCCKPTDASGIAVLDDLDLRFGAISENESFEVIVNVPRGRGTAAPLPLPFGGPIDLRLEVPPTGSIRVEITDRRGKRIAAAGSVSLRDITKSSAGSQRGCGLFSLDVSSPLESDGSLTFDRIALDRSYALVGSLDGFGILETTGTGPTRPDATTTIPLSVDDDSPALTGHLVDERGGPVRRCDLDCNIVEVRDGEKESRSPLPAIRTDDTGRFTIRPDPRVPMLHRGRRFLELEKLGGRWIATFPNCGYYVRQCERFAQIEIPVEGTVGRRSLGNVPLRDAVSLAHGRVVDRDHRPVIGADVSIHRSGEEDDPITAPCPWPNLDGTSDSEGAFEIVGRLPDGEFSLIASASGGCWSCPLPVPSEASDIELMVEPGGSLRTAFERIPGLELQLRLRRHHESRVGRWSDPLRDELAGDGSGDRVCWADRLRRGVVDVAVGLGRDGGPFLPIRTIGEVEILSGAPANDRRLERIEVRSAMRIAKIELTAPPSVGDLQVGQLDEHGRLASLVPLRLAISGQMNRDDEVPIVEERFVCGSCAGSIPPPPRFGTARRGQTANGSDAVLWSIDFPVAGERWNVIVALRERALLQIRDAIGPVTLVVPESRRVPIRMNPGLSRTERKEVRASVRLVPKELCDLEILAHVDERLDGDDATIPLLATGPNVLVLTLHSADSNARVERTLEVDLPDRVEQPPISIPFARDLYVELEAELKRQQSR